MSGYWNNTKDLITLESEGGTNMLAYENIGRVRAEGAEFEAEIKLAPGVNVLTSYSAGRAYDKDTMATLTNSPEQLIKFRIEMPGPAARSTIGAEVLGMSSRLTLAGTTVSSERGDESHVSSAGRLAPRVLGDRAQSVQRALRGSGLGRTCAGRHRAGWPNHPRRARRELDGEVARTRVGRLSGVELRDTRLDPLYGAMRLRGGHSQPRQAAALRGGLRFSGLSRRPAPRRCP